MVRLYSISAFISNYHLRTHTRFLYIWGMKLDAYIKLAKTTEKEIAKRADTTQATVNRIKLGKIGGSLKTLARICEATNWAVTMNDFIPEDKSKRKRAESKGS